MEFLVIDLWTQGRAIVHYTKNKGWNKEQILAWLAQSGIIRQNIPDREVYYFESRCAFGLRTAFFFMADNRLVLIGDNMTWVIPAE